LRKEDTVENGERRTLLRKKDTVENGERRTPLRKEDTVDSEHPPPSSDRRRGGGRGGPSEEKISQFPEDGVPNICPFPINGEISSEIINIQHKEGISGVMWQVDNEAVRNWNSEEVKE
jgi:hypothetical protein